MNFSSIFFLYVFFPAVILLHLAAPVRFRNIFLLLASVFFYAWGEPSYILLILFSSAFNFVMGIDIEQAPDPGRRKRSFLLGAGVNIFLLFFFKYLGFFSGLIHSVLPVLPAVRALSLPIGISFFTFQAVSYLADVYSGKTSAERFWPDFALYLLFFPQLIAGPIVKYVEIRGQLAQGSFRRGPEETAKREGRVRLIRTAEGVERLILGLEKKVLLANNLGILADSVSAAASRSVGSAWLGIFAYTLQIYYDFSGYSDMAIGLGKMFGFDFPENFSAPYLARSITDFWRRWHMTLSSWFREYVYIPLGGNRRGKAVQIRNLLIVWTLTGFWHGASLSFLFWGLYYGILLVAEKFLLGPVLERLPVWGQRIYTMTGIVIGWVLFSQDSLGAACLYLKNMFGAGAAGLADAVFLYDLRSNFLLLALAVWLCSAGSRKLLRRMSGKRPLFCAASQAVLFLLCTAYLIADSYNPFLYFRF